MGRLRRRLLSAQSRPLITDWDYEWSYLSGQLPQDERFIKSMTDNVYLTDDGLKFDGIDAKMTLADHDRIALHVKLNVNYTTGNFSRGFSVCLYGGNNEDGNPMESEYLFSGSSTKKFQDIGGNNNINNIYGTYKPGVDTEATIYIEFPDFSKGFVVYDGKKTYKKELKVMWFNGKSFIGNDNGFTGSEGYVLVKEIKFKKYD